MIYTTTFNPALDYIVTVGDFKLGMTNRTRSEELVAGGKGINVSLMLKNLGVRSTALGFTAGFTGEEICRRVEQAGINAEFITVPGGLSRINVKLSSIDGTEINGRGPVIEKAGLDQYYSKLDKLCPGDILVLAGSIPASMPENVYSDIMTRLSGRDIKIVVDASGELLMKAVALRPFLIKPNIHELNCLFGTQLETRTEVEPYAVRLHELGAENVLVSLGAGGAVLCDAGGGIHSAAAPEGRPVNSVGAGDSMVAGFLAGYEERGDYEYAFRMAIAAGSASAFSTGFAGREAVEALMQHAL